MVGHTFNPSSTQEEEIGRDLSKAILIYIANSGQPRLNSQTLSQKDQEDNGKHKIFLKIKSQKNNQKLINEIAYY